MLVATNLMNKIWTFYINTSLSLLEMHRAKIPINLMTISNHIDDKIFKEGNCSFIAKLLFYFSCPAEENEMEIQDNSISPQCRDRACFFSVIHIASYFLWGREGYNFF